MELAWETVVGSNPSTEVEVAEVVRSAYGSDLGASAADVGGSPAPHLPYTVVIPTYQRIAYVRDAVDSALDQTVAPSAVIVVDDGSTDGTADLLRALYGQRITVIVQSNQGEPGAVNRGVAAATTDVVLVLSSDDFIAPELAESLLPVLAADPDLVAVYPDWQFVDEGGRHERTIHTPEYDQRVLVVGMLCAPGPGAMFRVSALRNEPARRRAYHLCSDLDQWMRLSLAGEMRRVPRTLVSWRNHANTVTSTNWGRAMAEQHIALAEEFYRRADLPADLAQHRRLALSCALWLASCLHPAEASWPRRSLLLAPRLPSWTGRRRSLARVVVRALSPRLEDGLRVLVRRSGLRRRG